MSKKRKRYSSKEKVSILRRHFLEGVSVSDLCDENGIYPTMFSNWQKVFFEQGTVAFESQHSSVEKQQAKKIDALESKLTQKNEVLAELLEEHVKLKKSLGEF